MHLFERLGGLQYRYWSWPNAAPKPAKAKSTESLSVDERRHKLQAGFDYIEKEGPKANLNKYFTIWTEMNVIDESSPVFGWRKDLVQTSLAKYAMSTQLQMKRDDWPLTLKQFKTWLVMQVLTIILGMFETAAFLFVGEAGRGKSPLAKTLGMLFSMFHIESLI